MRSVTSVGHIYTYICARDGLGGSRACRLNGNDRGLGEGSSQVLGEENG